MCVCVSVSWDSESDCVVFYQEFCDAGCRSLTNQTNKKKTTVILVFFFYFDEQYAAVLPLNVWLLLLLLLIVALCWQKTIALPLPAGSALNSECELPIFCSP